MKELFGIPMNTIMLVLLALLAVSLATVLYVAVRNRIMFFLGIRNMPRRMAQTVLIVVGLMLSTLIISAAFTTGDTVDHSLSAISYSLLGHTDEWVQRFGEGNDAPINLNSTLTPDMVAGVERDLAANPNVDGYVAALIQPVPAVSPRSRQNEPSFIFLGVDASSTDAFPDIVSKKTGKALELSSLGPGEVFMNASGADALDVKAGDSVQIFVLGQSHDFKVVDIVKDTLLTGVGDFGSREGLVAPLDVAQTLFNKPGEASFIAVSNNGGVRSGLHLSSSVTKSLEDAFVLGAAPARPAVEIYNVKHDLVKSSEESGNILATFFLVLGLFSIAAGMLLIIMIFVMLAAERKSELGMARAVGTKRNHLIQMFLSEGMAYNILSAAVGAGLGVLVAFGMANIMGRLFSQFGFTIQPYVTGRSLVISYCLGVVLTFLTVTFASWRVSNLNIVRAIRDIPDPKGGRMGWRWLAVSIVGFVLGGLLAFVGLQTNRAFPFAFGFSIIIAAASIVLRWIGLRDRLVFTALGSLMLLFWGFTAGGRLEFLFGKLDGGIEMFFLSGVMMVAAMTFVMVYNADIVLTLLSRGGDVFRGLLPIMRTAVAYPLANRFRTGMTLAMIGLVIFALTMMSTMNMNFDRLFLKDSARGGWDVVVDENPNNPIADLSQALRDGGSSTADQFRAVGSIGLTGDAKLAEVKATGTDPVGTAYPVFSVDAGFVEGGHIPLSSRAVGFASDAAVWQALSKQDDVAVVDAFTLGAGGFGFGGEGFSISGIDRNDKVFDPIQVVVRDAVTGESRTVKVIGVISLGASASFFGVYIPKSTFTAVFRDPLLTRHYVGLQRPGEAKGVARNIEATLLRTGAQAKSIKAEIDKGQALSRNFFRLMQGFMGLGLFVGIAAVGVIAFRTVVERRQQIGMLRAIGYKRSTVAMSFMLESAFITLMGIVCGVGLAIWLAYFLVTSDNFPSTGVGFAIPWLQILLFGGLTFLASLVMTYIPSRQAAGVPTAEALRYE